MKQIFSAQFMILTLTFQTVRMVFGASTIAWLLYRYYLTVPLLRCYALPNVLLPLICNVLMILASCCLSVSLIRLIAIRWQHVTNNNAVVTASNSSFRSSIIRRYLVASVVIELLLAVNTLLLFLDLFDVTALLRQTLLDEVKSANSGGLLEYGYDTFRCCGVNFEHACSSSYPPVSQCWQGSEFCQNNCLNAFVSHFITPLRWERQMLGYAISPFVIANSIILSVVLAKWFARRRSHTARKCRDGTAICTVARPSEATSIVPLLVAPSLEEMNQRQITVAAVTSEYAKNRRYHLRDKLARLLRKLQIPSPQFQQRSSTECIVVQIKDRQCILQESFDQLSSLTPEQWRCQPFIIEFDSETGVDNGGLFREWFVLLIQQLFSRKMDLFTRPSNQSTYAINPKSSKEFSLQLYKFTGRLLAKTVLQGVLIGKQLAPSIFKRLLGEPGDTLTDLQEDDKDYYQGLIALRQLDEEALRKLDLRFVYEVWPRLCFDLAPYDRNTVVNVQNLELYVQLVAAARLKNSIEPQLKALLEGFHSIISQKCLNDSSLDAEELSALICGNGHISIRSLRKTAQYMNCNDATEQIAWLWQVLSELNGRERRRFMQFVSGVDAMPVRGSGSVAQPLTIVINNNQPSDYLPTAHTCFNQLEMPPYANCETLRQKLQIAITEGCEGFGLQ